MIKVSVVIPENISGSVIVKAIGHSQSIELCNAVSILMKVLESAFLRSDTKSIVKCNNPGLFELYGSANELLIFSVICFVDAVKWLEKKYKGEINLNS